MLNYNSFKQSSEDYHRIGQAIEFIENNRGNQPELKEIAKSVHLSEFHFQRMFKRWIGISPKRFLQYLTVEHVKSLISESKNMLEVTFEAGLSSSSRLHDLFLAAEAVSPGSFKNRGAGLKISYGIHPSPFGPCLISVTEKGICGLSFADDEYRNAAMADLPLMYPKAEFTEDKAATSRYMEKIFPLNDRIPEDPLKVFVMGTNFQIKVWQALINIPPGMVMTYNDIGRLVGVKRGGRAVGNAVALNPVSYIIPCHRVIRESGVIGKYQWGTTRKKALLAWESSFKDISA